MVQLKSGQVQTNEQKTYCFNSCMVQLKSYAAAAGVTNKDGFNSCMVQLKSVTNIGFSV